MAKIIVGTLFNICCGADQVPPAIPYSGWLGHMFLALGRLRELRLDVRVDMGGPHILESDLWALHLCPALKLLEISWSTDLEESYSALKVVSSLTQLTSLSLDLCRSGWHGLGVPKFLSNLQSLQSLCMYNSERTALASPDAANFLLEAIPPKVTRLGLSSMMYGFPDIDLLEHVQMLEASCWGTARYRIEVPSILTSDGPQLTWLRMLETSGVDARHMMA